MAISSSTFLNRTTPGVYVTEIDPFGCSIVEVATAVPVIVGYTEFAGDPVTGASLYLQPVAISSMAEYQTYFGGPAPTRYAVDDAALRVTAMTERFALHWQMRMFFANGGGNCFVVSCGSYWAGRLPRAASGDDAVAWSAGAIAAGDAGSGLLAGVAAAGSAAGATMILVPEACQLAGLDPATGEPVDAGYGAVASAMIAQAGSLGDRMAILDLPGCRTAATLDALTAAQRLFGSVVAVDAAGSYAAAYAPALAATVATVDDVTCRAIVDVANGEGRIGKILATEAGAMYHGAQLAQVQAAIAAAFPAAGGAATPPATAGRADVQAADRLLTAALPTLLRIKRAIAADLNVVAPSGAVAGSWAANDSRNGVWSAPANLALASVANPLVAMTDAEQGGFNVPTDGRAIDVIRAQPGRGTVIWGARTLDGNSLDYRYIQVRRTLIYVEQSLTQALRGYAFAANDATTWSAATASVASFLTGLWQQGGLIGSKPSDAFSVACGPNATMTADDVLAGTMIVSVRLQLVRPAEYIDLTLVQQVGG